MEVKVGQITRYIGNHEEYKGTYKIVYENGASVALEDKDLLIISFDKDVFLQNFTYDILDY